jgi:hypothetical protein
LLKAQLHGVIVPRSKKSANPFYVLLVLAGVSFVVTATAYGVMAFRDARPIAIEVQPTSAVSEHPLMAWMSRHGTQALISELVLLATFTFGAIATDDYWQRRNAGDRSR